VYQESLRYQIEQSPFTEQFTIRREAEDEIILGIFDESVERDKDKHSTRRKPRIIVFTVPEYQSGETKIIVREKEYKIMNHETDANHGSILWLV
jgi:hypothetical protein